MTPDRDDAAPGERSEVEARVKRAIRLPASRSPGAARSRRTATRRDRYRAFRVRAIYAFGSYATGRINLESDLDALIVRDTDLRRADRDLDIRLAFDRSIGLDLIVVTPDEYAEQLPATSFGQTILASAVRLDESR